MIARYCLRCGARLRRRLAFGHRRLVCPECGYVHFNDPKVAVGVLAQRRGRLLLVRRNHEPHVGGWSFPSGYVDAGEGLEAAALRETQEGTGLSVRLARPPGAGGAPPRAPPRGVWEARAPPPKSRWSIGRASSGSAKAGWCSS